MNSELTKEQLEDIEATLRQRLQGLREEIREAAEKSADTYSQGIAQQVTDQKDAAFVAMEAELNDADAARDATEIREIDAALTRLHEGRYGFCTDCGEAIAAERLKAYPSATRCRDCQLTFEDR